MTLLRPSESGKSNRPIAIDLFAGAGGLSLGFEQAGFDVVAAIDIDPIHCAVHKFNFPKAEVIARSVVGLTGEEVRLRAGIGKRSVDCVFGGPPCQGFSLIGHRMLEDPRNSLVLEFVRLVAELNARTFVFENVKGLTVGQHKNFLVELVEAFQDPRGLLHRCSENPPPNRRLSPSADASCDARFGSLAPVPEV